MKRKYFVSLLRRYGFIAVFILFIAFEILYKSKLLEKYGDIFPETSGWIFIVGITILFLTSVSLSIWKSYRRVTDVGSKSRRRIADSKRFFIDRIIRQAEKDRVHLDPLEISMLGWTSEKEEVKLGKEFDEKHDQDKYEKKMARLLTSAFLEDLRGADTDAKAERIMGEYRSSAKDIETEDHFLSIIIDEAFP